MALYNSQEAVLKNYMILAETILSLQSRSEEIVSEIQAC